ncbi:hypothetical protein VNI00_014562 [Paramarasmius palmivorus]|uniref:Uncharacterized protein n=1 Tax=Paramarasmius palmivorus TaxID=297713 RepID=A0AAW0BT59_9AGAR
MQRTILSATLESGLIYSAFSITLAVFTRGGPSSSEWYGEILLILIRAWPFCAGITASIVIVRVSLGIAFNDLRTEMTTVGALEVDCATELPQSQAAGLNLRAPRRKSDLSDVVIIGRDVEYEQSRSSQ